MGQIIGYDRYGPIVGLDEWDYDDVVGTYGDVEVIGRRSRRGGGAPGTSQRRQQRMERHGGTFGGGTGLGRRSGRRERMTAEPDLVIPGMMRGQGLAPLAAQQAQSLQHYGYPMTAGHELIASGQRIEPFGLGFQTLAADGAFIMQATTQKAIQGMGMVISATVLGASPLYGDQALSLISLNDLKMGTQSQFAGVNGVSALFYSPLNFRSQQMYIPIGSGVTVGLVGSVAGLPADHSISINATLQVVSTQQ